MKKLLLATRNKKKIEEIKDILGPLKFELITLDNFKGIPPVKEDKDSFRENASKKAKEVSKLTGLLCVSDDSGLEVDALGGKPGIYSSRFSGPNSTDEKNIKKLINLLKDTPENKRNARFVCWVVLADKGKILAATEGICKGRIILTPKGKYGFGYDPVFVPEGHNKTFAELGPRVKRKISHRAEAFRKMKERILELTESKTL